MDVLRFIQTRYRHVKDARYYTAFGSKIHSGKVYSAQRYGLRYGSDNGTNFAITAQYRVDSIIGGESGF